MKSLLHIGLWDQEQGVLLTGQLSRAFEAVFLLLDYICQLRPLLDRQEEECGNETELDNKTNNRFSSSQYVY